VSLIQSVQLVLNPKLGSEMSPRTKLVLHISAVVVTGGVYLPFWIIWIIYDKWNKSKIASFQLGELIKNTKFEIAELEESLTHHSAIARSLHDCAGTFPPVGPIIKIPMARLYESRTGASTTSTSGTFQAQTKTGTVGVGTKLGPIGLGVAASKGETRGSTISSSVTHPGRDQMTKIDEGDFILFVDSISFSGAQFSRSVGFESLLSSKVLRNEILIASKQSEKNWLIALNSDSVTTCAGQIIDYLATTKGSELSKTEGKSLLERLTKQNLEDTALFKEELSRKITELSELENLHPNEVGIKDN
jgi:hypothetical protein